MLVLSAGQRAFTPIRLVVADPHPVVLKGLRSIFAAQRDFEIVASCGSGTSCVEAIRKLAPDVALIANKLPDLTASGILRIVKAENLAARLLFFTEAETDDDLAAAIATGACSAISKYASPEALLRSLRLMTEGAGMSPEGNEVGDDQVEQKLASLTDRERQIVQLVSVGLSNKEIARRLNVSQGTVKVHLYNIFHKLEVSNRTVLAAIALSHRYAGFGVLTLAALAFATMNEVKASDYDKSFPEDDGTAYRDLEHGLFKLCAMEAILRHISVEDPNVRASRGSPVSAEELRAAPQPAPPNFARGFGPTGSSTTFGTNADTTVKIAHNPTNISTPTWARAGLSPAAAGVWICALDNSAAVQARDLGKTLIEHATLATPDGTRQVVTGTIHGAGDADQHDLDNLAAPAVLDDSHPQLVFTASGHGSVAGRDNTAEMIHGDAGNDTLDAIGVVDVNNGGSENHTNKGYSEGDVNYEGGSDAINGSNGNDTDGNGGDQLSGRNGDDAFVYLSAMDSNSIHFDNITDFESGSDKINLAAFGALAFLHLTSTSTSVPPHTVAWIYYAATNETIVYVNPTDDSLDIGDVGLLEIHLQGVVSVAESNFVYEPDAAAAAAAVEGIDPALLVNTASDGSVLTTASASADSINLADSEPALVTPPTWSMPPDDGLRFRFGGDRIDSVSSIKITVFGDAQVLATDETEDRALTASANASSVELAHGHATVFIDDLFTFRQEPIHASNGATTMAHGMGHAVVGPLDLGQAAQNENLVSTVTLVEPSATTGSGNAYGIPQRAAHPVAARAADNPSEPDLMTGNGNARGNPQHAAHPAAAKAADDPNLTAGSGNAHGNPQRAAHPAAAKAADDPNEPDLTTGNGNAHGNPQHAAHPVAVKASDDPNEPNITWGNGHGNLQRAAHPAAARAADDPSEPDLTTGNSNAHGNPQHAAAVKAAATDPNEHTTDNGNAHGNPEHAANAAAAKAADDPNEPDLTAGNDSAHGNPQHAAHPAALKAAADLTEPELTTGNGNTNGNPEHAVHPAAVTPVAAGEPAEITSGSNDGQLSAFHFNNHGAVSDSKTAVELGDPHVLLDHRTEVVASLEVAPSVGEEHAASHGTNGQHHAVGHSPHDLLI